MFVPKLWYNDKNVEVLRKWTHFIPNISIFRRLLSKFEESLDEKNLFWSNFRIVRLNSSIFRSILGHQYTFYSEMEFARTGKTNQRKNKTRIGYDVLPQNKFKWVVSNKCPGII